MASGVVPAPLIGSVFDVSPVPLIPFLSSELFGFLFFFELLNSVQPQLLLQQCETALSMQQFFCTQAVSQDFSLFVDLTYFSNV